MNGPLWENKYIPWKDAQIGGRYFDKYLFTADQMREAIRRAVEDTRLEYDKKAPTTGSNISGSGILSFDDTNVFEDEAFKVPRAPRLVGEFRGWTCAEAASNEGRDTPYNYDQWIKNTPKV